MTTAAASKPDFDPQGFIKNLTSRPGVYRMLDAEGEVLYVGKARNLKKRVASYFTRANTSAKTHSLINNVHAIEVTVTHTENEALLLENNIIKELKPRYNILLRDDKSYPYIYLSGDHDFCRISIHRGARQGKGQYFGPYPSAGAVHETLNLLQKLFRIRQCEDSFFRNRSRPCLQYQIKRCTAPCVGLVTREDYAADVRHAVMFLEGKNPQVIDELVDKMDQASQQLAFEEAAGYRDQIATLRKIQEKQYISGDKGDIDVIACMVKNGVGCVEVFYIRDGRNLGNKTFFPRHPHDADAASILAAFLPQYYLGRDVPQQVIINHTIDDNPLLQEVLSENAGHRVVINSRVRGERARWLSMAMTNAEQNIARHLTSKANMTQRFIALQEALNLDNLPQRLECFDISHTSGEATVAACVVFDAEGPVKADYRRFNIEDITGGDDYAAMKQALTRRYIRLKEGEGQLPDILFIDGGKGQVKQAEDVLEELQVSDVVIIGIAKGRERKPGKEQLYLSESRRMITLPADSLALHLIQQIRDEAHRFAITGHRQRRARSKNTSTLEGIPGIGPKRRRQLLKQFGGLQGIARAGIEDLANVEGISLQLARQIYDTFH
jgi:excinuclease ABC subunit C